MINKYEAKSFAPRECCGFVIKKYHNGNVDIYPCMNVAKDNENEYFIKIENYMIAERIGEIVGIYHSHTQGPNSFSEADITLSNKLELMHVLYVTETDKFYTYYPPTTDE